MKTKSSFLISTVMLVALLTFGFTGNKTKSDEIQGYMFIPMGNTEIEGRTYSIDAFWMAEFEVTNKMYNAFLTELQEMGMDSLYDIAKIHSENWKEGESYHHPYAEVYHSHPAYENYPVVNVSHEGAKLFCQWMSDNADNGDVYRLPTRAEWIYAARAGMEDAVYSWGGPGLRNKKGEYLGNFMKIGDQCIHKDSNNELVIAASDCGKKKANIPAPVDSYWPNDYGLHNTCGNAAEMLLEKGIAMGGSYNCPGYDVRILSELPYTHSSKYVGFRPVVSYKGRKNDNKRQIIN